MILGRSGAFGLTWARVRPPPMQNLTRCHFSLDAARMLETAAREFRKDEPRLDETVLGYVVGLDRGVAQFDGNATLQVLIDGRPRRVKASFEKGAYDKVIRAFQDRAVLTLDGDIYQVGQRLELRNPRDITLIDGSDEPPAEDAGPGC
jgi:hypothetical protein